MIKSVLWWKLFESREMIESSLHWPPSIAAPHLCLTMKLHSYLWMDWDLYFLIICWVGAWRVGVTAWTQPSSSQQQRRSKKGPDCPLSSSDCDTLGSILHGPWAPGSWRQLPWLCSGHSDCPVMALSPQLLSAQHIILPRYRVRFSTNMWPNIFLHSHCN